MKTCTICNVEKDETHFAFRNKTKGILHIRCRACVKEIDQTRYINLSDQARTDFKEKTKSAVIDVKTKLFNYLSEHPCVDCGQANPIVLDFDHVDATTKTATISYLSKKWSWNSLLTEIAKCVVRCANCHRIRTAKQFNYYSYIPRIAEMD